MRKLLASVATCGFIVLLVSVGAAQSLPRLATHPCTITKRKVPALCGTFRVYENRATQSGRTIALGFILLLAQHRSGHVIYFNPGGPGAPATEFADAIADGQILPPLWTLRNRYDILLLDNRGMGESHALDCSSIYSAANPAPYFLQLWPSDALRKCRARVSQTSDLSAYTTDNAADDLNDLRAALGYRRIVLATGSYGTYFSLVYMRRHPQTVESAVLDGVAPPHLLILPLEDAYGAQLAMDDVIAECASDRVCHRQAPLLAEHFAALVRRFDRGPISIAVRNPATHRLQAVRLSLEVFADRLRQMLYDEQGAAYVPYVIEQAYRGNYLPAGAMVNLTTLGFAQELDTGANLSYACAEQLPFITEVAVARTSANSFQGDTRVRAEQEACRIWNVRPVPESENAVVRSDLPVLMISGTNDPTSPAIYARRELRYLRNARIVLQRGAGHGETTQCTDRLIVEFVLGRSARHLATTACAGSFHRPPFVFSPIPQS
jgi:pimeloyl-ACP methyl ester carboxylesterase